MTKQLALISVPDPAPAADQDGARPTPAGTVGGAGARPPAGPRRSAGHPGWLDRRTIETGRQGVASARAALAEATRRVHERDEQRSTLRDQQLARQADVARHPAARSRRAA